MTNAPRPLRIAMVSDHLRRGGAAIAASRLADAFRGRGHEVHRLVAARPDPGDEQRATHIGLDGALASKVERSTSGRATTALRGEAGRRLARALDRIEPDVVNLHNLHGAYGHGWTAALAEVAAGRAPTIWTLHDMWSFTGRCAYSGTCVAFTDRCDATCPTPTEYPPLHPRRIGPAFDQRREMIARLEGRLRAVAPSQWLADAAKSGSWGAAQVSVIPYALDLDAFRPVAQREARTALGLPTDRPVLLASAQRLSDPRKGVDLLLDAASRIPNALVALLGVDPPPSDRVEAVALGHLGSADELRQAYSAADVFVHPAREDNAPLVVSEAMACGTPVAAVPAGGTPELVGTSGGVVATAVDGDALAEAIAAVLAGEFTPRTEAERGRPTAVTAAYEEQFARMGAG